MWRFIDLVAVVVMMLAPARAQVSTPKAFWPMTTAEGVAVGLDLGTTVARDRTLCPIETGTTFYYGRHGQRVIPVMLAELGVTTFIAWKLSRSHHWIRRFWWLPMLSTAATHSEGAAHNFARCL